MEDQALRARFEAVDEDRNGKIDQPEFAVLLATLNVAFTAEQSLTAFTAIDVNGNGSIEFGEFAAWWSDR